MSQGSVSDTDIKSNNHTCSFCDNILSEGIGSTCDFCDANLCESCRNICGDDHKDCGNVYCPDCCKICEIEQHEICNECLSWPNPRPEFEHIADICPSCDRIFCEEHSSTDSCTDCDRPCCRDCPVQYCEIDNWEIILLRSFFFSLSPFTTRTFRLSSSLACSIVSVGYFLDVTLAVRSL